MAGSRSARWTRVRIWAAAFLVAIVLGLLFVVQDLVFTRIEGGDVDWGAILAQETIPWLAWAALTPLLLLLLRWAPIERGRALRGIAIHLLAGPCVAATKLLVTSPMAALFVWRPAEVSYADGLRWLLVHRSAPNMVMYWLFVATYTAIVFARDGRDRSSDEPDSGTEDNDGAKAGRPIPLHTASRVLLVEADELDYVEVDGNYLDVHVGRAVHRIRATLTAFESALPAGRFVRIHRSRLVNVRRIREVHPWSHGDYAVVLSDGTELVTGRTYRAHVRRLLDRATR